VFGEFRYGAARPGSDDIRILGGWQQANIKPVEIPEIAGVKGAPRPAARGCIASWSSRFAGCLRRGTRPRSSIGS